MSWMKPQYIRKFQIFKRLLNKEDPVIVEIGAHFGEDSVRFSETFSKAVIHCFEPDPRCIKIFKKHVKSERIVLNELALSDIDGQGMFFQSYQEQNEVKVPNKYDWISTEDYDKEKLNASGASSLKKGYKHAVKNSVEVKTKRYDTWYKESGIKIVDLVWIDVQGAEKEVIDGMGDAIKNIKFIWTEYGETFYDGAMTRSQTINLLESLNFKLIPELSSRDDNGDLLFYNRGLIIK